MKLLLRPWFLERDFTFTYTSLNNLYILEYLPSPEAVIAAVEKIIPVSAERGIICDRQVPVLHGNKNILPGLIIDSCPAEVDSIYIILKVLTKRTIR